MKMLLLFIVAISSIASCCLCNESQVEFYCIDSVSRVSVCPGNARPTHFTNQPIAYAKYVNRINQTGWAELELVSNAQMDDQSQAYYSGYLEGFITARLIRSARYNTLEEDKNLFCQNLSAFIQENLNYTVEMVNLNGKSPYWQQVGLALYQIAGLDDGYALANGAATPPPANKPHLNIDPCGLILLNLNTESGDIQSILQQPLIKPKQTHCSAIVKALAGGDVLVAHNSWTEYSQMLRILKKYTLNYSTSEAKSVAMSSYPGMIFSIDDFYITSTQLVILETSIGNYNDSLWKEVKANGMVFEFIRNTVANRLAQNGLDWVKYFSGQNSGTYNNQFMIVDYKQLGQTEGLLTVLEQLPTVIMFADKTEHLLKNTYWPSYNVPYFKDIYHISENDVQYQKYGDFFSYDKTARALIFARDHSKVANVSTLFHLMRYNDMYHDPLARCNCTPPYTGEYAIAARCDLNDPNGTYPIQSLSFRSHGAIDAKMTSSTLAKSLQMVAVSGPTDENVPAFSWANTRIRNYPHRDQPTEWRFKPLLTVWESDGAFPKFKFNF